MSHSELRQPWSRKQSLFLRRSGRADTFFEDDNIGIISPTYNWGLPSIVKEFLDRADFHTDYLYFVATYGTTTGASGKMADKAIRGKTIDAYYSVRMPDTWTPIFDLSTPEKVARFSTTTEDETSDLIRKGRETVSQ